MSLHFGHWLLLALLGWLIFIAAWLLSVRWYYRVRAAPPELRFALTRDGWPLAVHVRRATRRRFAEPILLCHGLAANHRNFDFEPPYSLAHYLSENGFDCFTVDWRGTAGSRVPPRGRSRWDYSVDDHIEKDGPTLVRLALEETGAERAFWLGHSLGGLIGYGVAQGPEGSKLAGLVTMGSPVVFAYEPWLRAAVRTGVAAGWPRALHQELASIASAPFLGYVNIPLSDVIVNPKHIPPPIQRKVYANMMSSISRRVLAQFDDWITHDVFRSEDRRTDYRRGLDGLRLPVLVTGGSRDRLAPPSCLEAQFNLVGSPDKTMLVFGPENGDAMDYGHGDLIFGSGAPKEVYPAILRWLEERATPVD